MGAGNRGGYYEHVDWRKVGYDMNALFMTCVLEMRFLTPYLHNFMINNFEVVKTQLVELSDAINKFKSEAVQLRIVELIFAAEEVEPDEDLTNATTRRKRRNKKETKVAPESTKEGNGSQKRSAT